MTPRRVYPEFAASFRSSTQPATSLTRTFAVPASDPVHLLIPCPVSGLGDEGPSERHALTSSVLAPAVCGPLATQVVMGWPRPGQKRLERPSQYRMQSIDRAAARTTAVAEIRFGNSTEPKPVLPCTVQHHGSQQIHIIPACGRSRISP